MATTYGRKPFLCPDTQSLYAITVYSNTGAVEVNDAKAEEVLTKLMAEQGAATYKPLLRIQYNTALKFFYIVELDAADNAVGASFSERMKEVPKVFGRQAEYGYIVTESKTRKRHLTFSGWPSPIDEFLSIRGQILAEHRGLDVHVLTPDNPIPPLPRNTYEEVKTIHAMNRAFGPTFEVHAGRGFITVPPVTLLTLDGDKVLITDVDLSLERVNMKDFVPLIRQQKGLPDSVKE